MLVKQLATTAALSMNYSENGGFTMPKPRRVLSDLISEATSQAPLSLDPTTNLQTDEVRNEDKSQTQQVADLQTLQLPDTVQQTQQVSDLQTLQLPDTIQQTQQVPDLQTLQAPGSSLDDDYHEVQVGTTTVPDLQTREVRDEEKSQPQQVADLQTLQLPNTVQQTLQTPNIQTSQVAESLDANYHKVQERTSTTTNLQTDEVRNEEKSQPRQVTNLQTLQVPEIQATLVLPDPPETTPRYLQLERKEARLRADQIDDLNILTRHLNRQKRGKPSEERLTDNTLIRVAVDLLLQQKNKLQGTTEDELRSSLNLPPTQK
jgi:hypothetical protein